MIEAHKNAGNDFIQFSDHFLERFGWPIADTRRWRSNNFTTLIGAELHAPATKVGELWRIVAAGLPLDFAAPDSAETGPALAGEIRRGRPGGGMPNIDAGPAARVNRRARAALGRHGERRPPLPAETRRDRRRRP